MKIRGTKQTKNYRTIFFQKDYSSAYNLCSSFKKRLKNTNFIKPIMFPFKILWVSIFSEKII